MQLAVEYQHSHLTSCLLTANNELLQTAFSDWSKVQGEVEALLRNLLALESDIGIVVEKQGTYAHKLRKRSFRESDELLRKATHHRCQHIPLEISWNKAVCVIH